MEDDDEGSVLEESLAPTEEQNPASVYTLDLSDKGLQLVPKTLRKYKFCKSLKLSCNAITSIQKDDFSTCTQLKELKLYGNKIKSVHGLWPLERLAELHLQFNEVEVVGDSLKTNNALTFLRLDNNKIAEIKQTEICMLGRLTYLDISYNKLQNISALAILSALEVLMCSNNLLTAVPNLNKLKKLKEVDISSNSLSDLSGFKGCGSLRVLTCHGNKLMDLSSMGTFKGLQELKLRDNLLHDLQKLCSQFPGLEILDVSNNKIAVANQLDFLFNLAPTLKELLMVGNPFLEDPTEELRSNELIKNNLKLEMLNGIAVHKPSTSSSLMLMRPMSAGHVISQRMLEDEMNFAAVQMEELEHQIKSQFVNLKDSLKELPDAEAVKAARLKGVTDQSEISDDLKDSDDAEDRKSAKSSLSPRLNKMKLHGEIEERPGSRCGTRARLHEAIAFAQHQQEQLQQLED